MNNLLALDQSSTISGYTIFNEGKPIKISHFSAGTGDIGKRLLKIRQKIQQLIKENNIDRVAFEDIQLQSSARNNVKTFKILAQVQGTIISLLEELEIPYEIIPPITWKSTFKIAGKGRAAEKKMAQQQIKILYNIECTEDEADATCLGLHVLSQQKKPSHDWS